VASKLPAGSYVNREKRPIRTRVSHRDSVERGFGHTVWQQPAPHLLASLEGRRRHQEQDPGGPAEFSSSPDGEDITEPGLETQGAGRQEPPEQSRRSDRPRPQRGRLVVTAAEILHDESIEINQPDPYPLPLTRRRGRQPGETVEKRKGLPGRSEGHTAGPEVARPDSTPSQPGHPDRSADARKLVLSGQPLRFKDQVG